MTLSLPAYTQDLQFPFQYLRMGMHSQLNAGVVSIGDMSVSPGSGLQVQIAVGEAYVQQTVSRLGSFYSQRGLYYVFNDSVNNPYNSLATPISEPRVDTIVARVYDAVEQSLGGQSFWRYEWISGTETPGATLSNLDGVATLPDNCLGLSYVLRETTEGGSISSGNILNVVPPLDSGWIALPFPIGWIAYGSGEDLPAIRLVKDRVWFQGVYTNNTGTDAFLPVIALPEPYFVPPTYRSCATITHNGLLAQRLIVAPAANSEFYTNVNHVPNGDAIVLDGCSYSVLQTP